MKDPNSSDAISRDRARGTTSRSGQEAAEFTGGVGAPGALSESSGLYQLLVESVIDYAIFALNPNGIILSWNSGARHFKGYTAEEIIGKHFSVFYREEERAAGKPAEELRI